MPVECVCQTCGKSFFLVPSIVAKGKGKFCSKDCAYPIHERVCENCGKTFRINAARLARGGGKYCSKACYHPEQSLEERFWSKVAQCPHDPFCPFCCWEWQAARNEAGYGVIRVHEDGKYFNMLATRLMWKLINGRDLPASLHALHHCDWPPCINPWHVYPGTQSRNMQDAHDRNRYAGTIYARGERQRCAKLREQDIPLVFAMHQQGMGERAIGKHFGVAKATIHAVLHYETWTHVSLALTAQACASSG